MGFFSKLFGKTDWDKFKKLDAVYPQGPISVVMLQTESGKPATGWINKGYQYYKYKKYCPYNFLIMVDLTDEVAERNPDLDMETVENYFLDNFRKIGTTHMVARLVTDKGLNIEMYTEYGEEYFEMIKQMMSAEDRLVSFECEINEDNEWGAVSGLMQLLQDEE